MVSTWLLPRCLPRLHQAPRWQHLFPHRPLSTTPASRHDETAARPNAPPGSSFDARYLDPRHPDAALYDTGDANASPAADPDGPDASDQEPFDAAPPIADGAPGGAEPASASVDGLPAPTTRHVRVVPASRAYFSGRPGQIDDLVELEALARSAAALPTLPASAAPRVTWLRAAEYGQLVGERVGAARHARMAALCARLNRVHPRARPPALSAALAAHARPADAAQQRRVPPAVDEWGRGYGVGRRKSSSAQAWVVEGEGRVLVNGKGLHQVFGRVRDRESAVWALLQTQRAGRYNVWARVHGGGTTGQAEALAMAVGRGLEVLEPDLKPALRRAGVLTRDPRKVERKKPGHVKARKMPAWVKR